MTVYKVLNRVKGSLQGMVKEICDGARICITTLGLKGHMGNGYQNPERLFVIMGRGSPNRSCGLQSRYAGSPLEGRRKPNTTGRQNPREARRGYLGLGKLTFKA